MLNNKQIEIIKTILKTRYAKPTLIGRGSYAVIFRIAKDKAIKVFFDTDKDHSTRNEINLLSNLNHQNIIKIFDIGKIKNYTFIEMEYGGFNLYELMQFNHLIKSTIPETTIKVILKQLTNCIEYLHYNKILHRDIKIINTLINDDGLVKVIDFGTALKVDKEPIKSKSFNFGYDAPEIALDNKAYFKSDIWSIGATIYQLITGVYNRCSLFDEDNYFDEVRNKEIDIKGLNCSDELKQILNGILQRNIEKRIDISELKKQTDVFTDEPLKIYVSYLMKSKTFQKYLDYIRNAELYKILHFDKFINLWKREVK